MTQPEGPRGRWVDQAVSVILAGAVVTVLVSATPSILRAAGVGAVAQTAMGSGRAIAPHSDRASRPLFQDEESAEDGDDDSADDLMRLYPEPGNFAGKQGKREEARDDDTPHGPMNEPKSGVTIGASRSTLELLDQPDSHGVAVGTVKAGESLMIVKAAGDWVLVVHSGADDVAMGWTKKSGIAVR